MTGSYTRREDWPERLGEVLRANRKRAFVYGAHDCILNAADAAEAITGQDPAADYRGQYDSYAGGLRRLAAVENKRSIVAWADGHFRRRRHISSAQRGDWALIREAAEVGGRPHPVLTVVDGDHLVSACGVQRPLSAATLVWRVG